MINVFGSLTGQAEINNVTDSLKKQWLGMGPKVADFEKRMEERLGLPNFLMVDSGSNGLYMAMELLDLPKGSEVIVPSFTWVSCAQAVLLAGCKPVFCDVDIETQNLTREMIEPQITDKTSAIMVVHYAGLPVEIEPIIDLGYPIIEDAAHAVDSHRKGTYCGGLADVGLYSFDAVKNLCAGEGGGVTVKEPSRFEKARVLRYCGIGKSGFEASTHGKQRWWEYNILGVFIKMNPSDISAGIALGQLDSLDKNQAIRKEIWDTYQQEFASEDWIVTPAEAPDGDKHSYFTYAIRAPKRDELAHYLLDKGIYTTLRYHPLHMNPIYGQMDKKLPNCEQLNEDALSIPLHPNLKQSDVEMVIESIKSFKSML